MYVSEFQLDAFGGGPPLRFLDLGNGLNVALTYSDEGAIQLLQVVPATLFGDQPFFAEIGSNALPAALGTSLMLRTEDGAFHVSRRWDVSHAPPTVTTSDHQVIGRRQWAELMAKVRPREYSDVFTFDLERLQRILGSRRRTMRMVERLARQLSDASVLPGRDKSEEPRNPRSGIHVGPLRSGLQRLESLVEQASQEEPAESPRGPGRLRVTDEERNAAESDFRQLFDRLMERELDWRRHVAAQSWLPLRDQLRDLERQRSAMERASRPTEPSTSTPQALDRLDERVATHREELKALQLERQEIQRQLKELDRHRVQDELIPQVEALMLQHKPLAREEDALEQLRNQLEDLESRAEWERGQPQLSGDEPSRTSAMDAVTQARFDSLADRVREAERERELADQQVGHAEAAAIAAPATESAEPLPNAVTIHQAQQRVQQLRQQMGRHDDLHDIRRKRSELQHQVRQLYTGQLLPVSTVLLFGVPFAVGVGMIIHAVFTAHNGMNWNQVLWGGVLTLVSVVIKIIRDRERGGLLAGARRKLARWDERLQRAGDDVPAEDTALVAELRAAEQELDALQSPVPAQAATTQSSAPAQSLDVARRRVQQANQRCRELNQQWRELLISLDLSPSLTPAHAREALAERALRDRSEPRPLATTADGQIPFLRKEIERRQDWLQQQMAAFQSLAKELGRPIYGHSISDHADVFHDVIREARERKQQRTQWHRADQRLRQKMKTLRDTGRRLVQQRRQLKAEWGRTQKQQHARQQRDQARREQLDREIQALTQELQDRADRYQLDPQLPPCTLATAELTDKISELQQLVESLRDRLLAQAEQRGRLRATLEEVEHDGDPAASPSASWQPLQRLARDLKRDLMTLESEVAAARSPQRASPSPSAQSEYLAMASRLLRRLSGGYFRQMSWQGRRSRLEFTDRHGRTVSVQRIRPAHFANVYFALWLTRLEQYADRGIRFPIVLDDPLRVTAERRKSKVAAMLRKLASTGHQMLLVTRNRQHARVFGHLGVPIADLSDREHASGLEALADHSLRAEVSDYETQPVPRLGERPATMG